MKNISPTILGIMALFVFMLPNVIFADVIIWPMAVGLDSAWLFLLFCAFIVFAETVVISKYLKIKDLNAVKFVFVANLLTGLVGPPAMLFVGLILSPFLVSIELSNLAVLIVVYFFYFSVSVVIEYEWGMRWKKKNSLTFSGKALFWAVLWANIVTYAILTPIHYFYTGYSS
jgi:hypothetical protein